MASQLCGQAAWKERGQDHHSRHDVMTRDMIRQLPPGFALVVRGGLAPVVAKLPAAWRDKAYRAARRRGDAVAALSIDPELLAASASPTGTVSPAGLIPPAQLASDHGDTPEPTKRLRPPFLPWS